MNDGHYVYICYYIHAPTQLVAPRAVTMAVLSKCRFLRSKNDRQNRHFDLSSVTLSLKFLRFHDVPNNQLMLYILPSKVTPALH